MDDNVSASKPKKGKVTKSANNRVEERKADDDSLESELRDQVPGLAFYNPSNNDDAISDDDNGIEDDDPDAPKK